MRKRYTRQGLYQLLAVGKRELGWDEDLYRLWLEQQGAKAKDGRISATTLSMKQLFAALEDMRRKGFTPKRLGSNLNTVAWRKRMIAKLNAMWCELADAGHVRNRSEQAMAAWCCNQVKGLQRLEWATPQQMNAAIEALKGWCTRVGLVHHDGRKRSVTQG